MNERTKGCRELSVTTSKIWRFVKEKRERESRRDWQVGDYYYCLEPAAAVAQEHCSSVGAGGGGLQEGISRASCQAQRQPRYKPRHKQSRGREWVCLAWFTTPVVVGGDGIHAWCCARPTWSHAGFLSSL